MKKFFCTCAAVALTLGLAGTANAAINVGSVTPGTDPYSGPAPTYDFETPGTTPTYVGGLVTTGSVDGVRAQPLGSTGNYYTVGPTDGTPGTIDLTSFGDIYNLSFIWGSVDDYNLLEFLGADGTTVLASFSGALFNPSNGCQTCTDTNPVVTFLLSGADVSAFSFLRFGSTQNAFEIDNIAINAVPEPGTWAMMLFGFAGIGMAMRRRRSAITQLA